jgi:hypothetical protein
MKIYFERSGGFMGRSVSTVVDTNQIPPERALTLLEKIEDADFFDLPEEPGALLESGPLPDEINYKVTVEVAGVQHTVETSEASAPQQLQPLLQELSRFERESNRPMGSVGEEQSNWR